jgi:hypothetical protein
MVETSAAKVVTLVVREVMSCFSSSRVVWSPMDAVAWRVLRRRVRWAGLIWRGEKSGGGGADAAAASRRGTVELGLCAGEEILALNTKMIGLIFIDRRRIVTRRVSGKVTQFSLRRGSEL